MRVLGIDYGRRRIGLALSDATGLLARPWKTLSVAGNSRQVAVAIGREVASLRAEDDGLDAVVLGLPKRLSGDAHELTRAVESVAGHLRGIVDVPVLLQDERLTSHEADQRLAAREPDWRKRKQQVDAMAAAIILQDYLDARPRESIREDRDP